MIRFIKLLFGNGTKDMANESLPVNHDVRKIKKDFKKEIKEMHQSAKTIVREAQKIIDTTTAIQIATSSTKRKQ